MIISTVRRWIVLISDHLQLLSLSRWTIEDISFAASTTSDFLKMHLCVPDPFETSIILTGQKIVSGKQQHVYELREKRKPCSKFGADSLIISISRK